MPLDDVAAEASVRRQCSLQVYSSTRAQIAEVRAVKGHLHHVGGEGVSGDAGDGQADAVDTNGITQVRAI